MSKPYAPDPDATAGPLARSKHDRLSLYLPQAQRRILQEVATRDGTSLSKTIRALAMKGLKCREKCPDTEEADR